MLSKMTSKFDVRLHGRSTDLKHLDITSYLSAPNPINTYNNHVGTVYRIFTDLSDMGWRKKHTPLYNRANHVMGKIEKAFNTETGQVCRDEEGQLKVQVVVDWPISDGILGTEEYSRFFKRAEHLNIMILLLCLTLSLLTPYIEYTDEIVYWGFCFLNRALR